VQEKLKIDERFPAAQAFAREHKLNEFLDGDLKDLGIIALGLPAVFLFGGDRRSDRTLSVRLVHGDVVVWGGPARLRYHGVRPLADGVHPMLGRCRINLTVRKAR